MTTETRTDAAEKIAENWLGAEGSNANDLYKKLSKRDRKVLRAALVTAVLNGVTEGERRIENHLKEG